MLLKAIAGVLSYSEGVVLLDGIDVRNSSPRDIARAMALVPQVAPYTQGFTALELVLMGRYPHMSRFQIESREDNLIARNAMRLTETEQFTDRTLDTLSGGERQRIFVSPCPGTAAPRPSAGRTNLQPGCPSPAEGDQHG